MYLLRRDANTASTRIFTNLIIAFSWGDVKKKQLFCGKFFGVISCKKSKPHLAFFKMGLVC